MCVGLHGTKKLRRQFFPSPLISLPSTSKCGLTLQSCKVILNHLIVSNSIYLFFNFVHWHLIFYVFFYQIWFFFLFLFILFLIFFFVEFDLHSYDCNSFYFEFSSWLIFFLQFHPLLFNFIELSYHIWCFFLSYF
jgi:hypothetical protein